MGAIWFEKNSFADHLHELLGYKSGVAASIEHMCDLLTGTSYADDIMSSEKYGIRIRTEDYESIYYELLYKVGATPRKLNGHFEAMDVLRELEIAEGMDFTTQLLIIYRKHIELETEKALREKKTLLDPSGMMREAMQRFGKRGLDGLLKIIDAMNSVQTYSPLSTFKCNMWNDILNLDALFNQHKPVIGSETFLDQRFIDYLSNNPDKLKKIHWRKFEELIAECFSQFGYNVELGPGTNDDGIDARVWHPNQKEKPKYIIQCKRYNTKIDKVIIKGLYADVVHEGAEIGLLVTTSEFSPGARTTVAARGYPIEEINGDNIAKWLNQLRTPGTGIVRV